jgi:hypothetical protein
MKKLVGNCTNSFDENGSCLFDFFIDVSDFAVADEAAMEMDKKQPLSVDDFWTYCTQPKNRPWDRHEIRYLYDERTGIFMLYDETEDVHHFFA